MQSREAYAYTILPIALVSVLRERQTPFRILIFLEDSYPCVQQGNIQHCFPSFSTIPGATKRRYQ